MAIISLCPSSSVFQLGQQMSPEGWTLQRSAGAVPESHRNLRAGNCRDLVGTDLKHTYEQKENVICTVNEDDEIVKSDVAFKLLSICVFFYRLL